MYYNRSRIVYTTYSECKAYSATSHFWLSSTRIMFCITMFMLYFRRGNSPQSMRLVEEQQIVLLCTSRFSYRLDADCSMHAYLDVAVTFASTMPVKGELRKFLECNHESFSFDFKTARHFSFTSIRSC